MDTDTIVPADKPPIFNYVLSFLLVGVAWGFTTPFIRRAAADFNARQEAKQNQSQHGTPLNQSEGSRQEAKREGGREGEGQGWLKAKLSTLIWTIINLLRTPAYSIPLVVNLTGSVWFFLLVGQHELSLTVPLANSSAFLFTVLGEWYVEKKVIAKETWIGMTLVLAGIGICVQSKNS